MLAISYIFFMPYFDRRLIKGDARLRWYHIPLGPMLRKDNVKLYFPGDANGEVVTDHYKSARRRNSPTHSSMLDPKSEKNGLAHPSGSGNGVKDPNHSPSDLERSPNDYGTHPEEPLLDKEYM
jgi:sodium-dependent phosphate transporter